MALIPFLRKNKASCSKSYPEQRSGVRKGTMSLFSFQYPSTWSLYYTARDSGRLLITLTAQHSHWCWRWTWPEWTALPWKSTTSATAVCPSEASQRPPAAGGIRHCDSVSFKLYGGRWPLEAEARAMPMSGNSGRKAPVRYWEPSGLR